MIRRWLFLLFLVVSIITIDQISKNWVLENIILGQSISPIPALVPYFQLTLSYNTGAAFGMLPNAGDFFLLVAIGIVILLLYWYPRTPENAWLSRVATGLVVGGALGNVIDRLQHGHVIDFIHYRIPGVISNVSNLADHAIVFGVIVLMIANWWVERQAKNQRLGTSQTNLSAPEEEAPTEG